MQYFLRCNASFQPVNYSQLSGSGTRKLITDFVSIVDNLANTERSEEWIGIQNQNSNNNQTKTGNKLVCSFSAFGCSLSYNAINISIISYKIINFRIKCYQQSAKSTVFAFHH